MRAIFTASILGMCSVLFTFPTSADEPTTPEQQIRAGIEDFVATFNHGDAKKLSEFWTEDGDYIDEAGQRFAGRAAIEGEYAIFFERNPGAKIAITVDAIRMLDESHAIEDGRAIISPLPQGPPTKSRYTVVHVKHDGRWLMASVRDSRVDVPSNYAALADLEFLVGTWKAENEGMEVQIECDWLASKSFLERKFTVTANNQPESTSKEIIGWDPQNQVVKSWTFPSHGGHATGIWSPHEVGWMIVSDGTLPDGTPTSSISILSHVDNNTMAWKSVRRRSGDADLPDTRELLLKRSSKADENSKH